MSKTPAWFGPKSGFCCYCGEALAAYENKGLHPDGRMACNECVEKSPEVISGGTYFSGGFSSYSDG